MSKFSVKKPLTVFVAIVVVLVLGIVSFTRMTPDLLPNIDLPYVLVTTAYPGASPEEVEREVSKPLEQSMATLDDIETVSSVSNENYSMLIMQFADGSNLDTVTVDILQKINTVSGGWDEMVQTPTILKINPNMLPVSIAAVDMEGMDTAELSEFVNETLLNKLEGINGVASVSAEGLLEEQVTVTISADKIAEVNTRIRKAIDEGIDEKLDELNETRDEMQGNLNDLKGGKNQLNKGKDALNDTAGIGGTLTEKQAELASAKQLLQLEIAALELALEEISPALEQLYELMDGITALEEAEKQINETLEMLYQAQELIAGEQELLAVISQLKKAIASWDELRPAIEDLEYQLSQLPETDPSYSALEGKLEELKKKKGELEAGLAIIGTDLDHMEDTLTTMEGDLLRVQGHLAQLDAQLAAMGYTRADVPRMIAELEAQRLLVQGNLALMDESLAALGLTRADVPAVLAELESAQMELNNQLATMKATLAQLEAGAITINDALAMLESEKTGGILTFSEMTSQIVVGEIMLEQALEQIDSGLEQLEDAREDAYKSANAGDIITLEMVSKVLYAQNFRMPAGYVENDGQNVLVTVGDTIKSRDELESLVLFDLGMDGMDPIMLTDVATVEGIDNADDIYANINGNSGVLLSFSKQSNFSTADVSDNINDAFDELSLQYPGLQFTNLMDQGDYIYMVVYAVIQNLLTGALLAVIVLFIFLKDYRPTVVTLVSIPISVLFAFVLMYFSGVSLNMFSLSGLAVAVGMLVDNSVVVIENIYRLRAKGVSAIQAAVSGAAQVGGAIAASTLTTVAIFMPIVFIEGITRQLFTDFALTFAYALIASLVIALTVVPSMSSRLLKGEMKKHRQPVMDRVLRVYKRSLKWTLNHKLPVLAGVLALLLLSAALVLVQGFTFMPEMDMGQLTVSIEMPEDATFEDTAALSDTAVERYMGIDGVETVGAMISGGGLLMGGGDNTVTMYVLLDGKAKTANVAREIDALSADLDAVVTSSASSGMDISALGGSGITVTLYGDDMDTMQAAAVDIAGRLAGVEGIASVDDGIDDTSPEIRFIVDKAKAMEHGLTVAQVYAEISAALTSEATATTITDENGDSYEVLVVNDTGEELTPAFIKSYELKVEDNEGEEKLIPIGSIAEIVDTETMNSIRRTEGQRYMSITAELEEGYNVTLVTQDAESQFAGYNPGGGMRIEFGGENETIMEALQELVLMLLLGILLVYLIMVAQFQSLKSPFIVMFTIPLAFTGGLLALLVTGNEMSVISLIGFVMLVGIIVNNGIVLVDYINQLRAEGERTRKAIVEAGVTRMRPILMTSITTIFGLLTMAIGVGTGTDIMQPIAIVCIGGLLYATLLTLYVVPCMYEMLNRKDLNVIDDSELEIIED